MQPKSHLSAPAGFALVPADDQVLTDQCLAMRRAVFTEEYGIPRSVEQDELDRPGSGCRQFLLRLNGRSVGALRCAFPSPGVVRLQRFCVLSGLRGQGIGRAALAALEDYCRPIARRVELDAKFRVEGFYLACGYRTVSEVFWEAGVEHVKMVKELS